MGDLWRSYICIPERSPPIHWGGNRFDVGVQLSYLTWSLCGPLWFSTFRINMVFSHLKWKYRLKSMIRDVPQQMGSWWKVDSCQGFHSPSTLVFKLIFFQHRSTVFSIHNICPSLPITHFSIEKRCSGQFQLTAVNAKMLLIMFCTRGEYGFISMIARAPPGFKSLCASSIICTCIKVTLEDAPQKLGDKKIENVEPHIKTSYIGCIMMFKRPETKPFFHTSSI